jgi:hypothetical protein
VGGRVSAQAIDIPAALPALTQAPVGPARPPWWRRETTVAMTLLVVAWLPPLWDEAFGTHNLTAIWNFFTSPHAGHSWDAAWRLVSAMYGIVLFQHHAAIHDGVADLNPFVTTAVFVALAGLAVFLGLARGRPAATWLGVSALVGAPLCVYSVTRVVGLPYRYLLAWMVAMPALPVLGVVAGLRGGQRRSTGPRGSTGRSRAAVLTALLTVLPVGVAVLAGADAAVAAPAAAALTDRDIVRAWDLIRPALPAGTTSVRLQINDGARWPSAAGVALELEQHGHPARVDPPWTLLFGNGRRASGHETGVIVIAGADETTWPQPSDATLLGAAGRARYFVALRSGSPDPVR